MSSPIKLSREAGEVVIRVPVELEGRVFLALEANPGDFGHAVAIKVGTLGPIGLASLHRLSDISTLDEVPQ